MSQDPREGWSTTTPKSRGANSRRQALLAILRVAVVTTVLCVLYVLAPLDGRSEDAFALRIAVSLVVLAVVVMWQIIAVMRSPYPRLRGIEGAAFSVPLLILLFASAYVSMSTIDAGSFTSPLSKVDSVYFTVTVFATVGFGDIVPKTEIARILVTIQMIADLVLIGVLAKVLLGAVQQRRRILDTAGEEERLNHP
jgi:voltage-gated potassium channel